MLRTLPPTRFIPPGAVKVTDKHSDAVVYAYSLKDGRPGAIGYHGKAAKPDFWLRFGSEERRTTYVRDYFASRQARARMVADNRASAAKPHNLEPGHVLVASWGYDQTNVNWYQVIKVISASMVEVREICGESAGDTGPMQGRCIPALEAFKGEAMRRRVIHGGVKINESVRAYVWDGRPRSWSSYH